MSSLSSFRFFLLGLLSRERMSGYDIKRFLKNLNWLIGSPGFGNLYPALHALLDDDLVTVESQIQDGKPMRKIYGITPEGAEALKGWIEQPLRPDAPLKTFMMRLIVADSFSLAGLVTYIDQRHDQVTTQRDKLAEILKLKSEEETETQRLAFDYGLVLANAELAWLQKTFDQLSQSTLDLLPLEAAERKDSAATA